MNVIDYITEHKITLNEDLEVLVNQHIGLNLDTYRRHKECNGY